MDLRALLEEVAEGIRRQLEEITAKPVVVELSECQDIPGDYHLLVQGDKLDEVFHLVSEGLISLGEEEIHREFVQLVEYLRILRLSRYRIVIVMPSVPRGPWRRTTDYLN